MRDHGGHTKVHRAGASILIAVAVDLQIHGQVLWVSDLVARDKPRTDWAKRICGFAFDPLARAMDLKVPLGQIVDHAIARHMVQRVFFAHVFGVFADDDAQLDLPIGFYRCARDFNRVVGPDDS